MTFQLGSLEHGRKVSVPIRKRTSDDGICVRGKVSLMCTVRFVYAAELFMLWGPAVAPDVP